MPLDRHVVVELDRRVLVRDGSPHLAVRLKAAEDLASCDKRPVVVDRDVDKADALKDAGVLAGPGHVQRRKSRPRHGGSPQPLLVAPHAERNKTL
jgi:hypothetical protein